jgi:hypothetical protein
LHVAYIDAEARRVANADNELPRIIIVCCCPRQSPREEGRHFFAGIGLSIVFEAVEEDISDGQLVYRTGRGNSALMVVAEVARWAVATAMLETAAYNQAALAFFAGLAATIAWSWNRKLHFVKGLARFQGLPLILARDPWRTQAEPVVGLALSLVLVHGQHDGASSVALAAIDGTDVVTRSRIVVQGGEALSNDCSVTPLAGLRVGSSDL